MRWKTWLAVPGGCGCGSYGADDFRETMRREPPRVDSRQGQGRTPAHSFPLHLDLTICSLCTGVPVYTRRFLLLARPPGCVRFSARVA